MLKEPSTIYLIILTNKWKKKKFRYKAMMNNFNHQIVQNTNYKVIFFIVINLIITNFSFQKLIRWYYSFRKKCALW